LAIFVYDFVKIPGFCGSQIEDCGSGGQYLADLNWQSWEPGLPSKGPAAINGRARAVGKMAKPCHG